MNSSNRRTFIKAAGAGAAAVGAVTLVPSATGTLAGGKAVAAAPAPAAAALPAAAKGAMVAYIHDVSKGEVSVMVEGHEVTVTDHQLVAKIANAFHSSNKA